MKEGNTKMENRYTPGPWYIEQIHSGYFITASDGNGWKDNRYMNISGIIDIHDARLIAAAPELLEALIKVMRDVDNNQMWDYVDQMGIINVINKALGTPINETDTITQSNIEREANNG